MKKWKFKLFSAFLALSIITSIFTPLSASASTVSSNDTKSSLLTSSVGESLQRAGSVDIAMYRARTSFYYKSPLEPLRLETEADTVSLIGFVEEGSDIDVLVCTIQSEDTDYQIEIPFEADGELRTYPFTVPKGRYKIQIFGSSEIKKKDAWAILSVVE